MTPSRKQLRTDLKAELASSITSLQSTDDFFVYEPADYGSRSPIIFLRSAGTEEIEETKTKDDTNFYIQLHTLVLYADLANASYNEEDAADLQDDLEYQVRAAVKAKRVVANKWQKLSVFGRSIADQPVAVGGDLYLHEVITLRARLY